MSFYLDTSALVPLFIPEAGSEPVQHWMAVHDNTAHISDFAVGEFGAALSKTVRMALQTAEQASAILADFDMWRAASVPAVETVTADIAQAGRFVRQFDLKLLLPDAIHVATCQRLGFALVTLDQRLAEAARALGVEVVVPE